ncbi:MAG: hypothetical protein FVQ84_21815 [Planctomycetes bacterium]|nr:hypothetical protein [Planctomycetota bacterium]
MKCGNLRVMKFKAMLLLLYATCGLANVNRVPSDYTTIQAAIDVSMDGDTVLVAPGTYTGNGNRDIDFKGKAITVKSEEGPQTCIIDCQGTEDEQHRGFYFHNGEDANSVVQGFTITNGLIREHKSGGGILCDNSSPRIIDCIIVGNEARTGGGIATINSSVQIIDCLIKNNVAADGGGIEIGLHDNGVVLIKGCIVVGNHAVYYSRFGGEGGGILAHSSSHISNCTIAGNRGGYSGGGICFRNGARVSNCIIWGNTFQFGFGNEVAIMYHNDPWQTVQRVFIENSLVGNGIENDFGFVTGSENYISGQWLQEDPLFVAPGHLDPNGTQDYPNNYFWIDGDYHLKSKVGRWDPNSESWVMDDVTSPCIDVGDPNSLAGDEPEPNGGRINMGAYGGTAEASKSGDLWWFETTQGPIAAEGLGVILSHEHIFTDLRGPGTRGYGQADAADVVRVMAPLLEEAKQKGVGVLFECSSIGVGRSVSILSDVSAASGLPVVVPTGVYGRANFAPPEHKNMSEDELTALFISEIRDRIEGTDIKAGFIKIATGGGTMTALEEKILRAAGRAARETGAAIASHTTVSSNITRQADILESISPDIRFIWVHAQSVNNISLYRQLAERGVFIEFDSLGWNPGQDSTFITAIKELLAAGYGERILLSHDAGWYQPGEKNGGTQKPYTYLIEIFIPKLRDSGVDDDAIRMITEINPIRAFGFNQDVNP